MDLSIQNIILVCILIGGLVWFFPRMPSMAQIIAAIIGVLLCGLALAKMFGLSL